MLRCRGPFQHATKLRQDKFLSTLFHCQVRSVRVLRSVYRARLAPGHPCENIKGHGQAWLAGS